MAHQRNQSLGEGLRTPHTVSLKVLRYVSRPVGMRAVCERRGWSMVNAMLMIVAAAPQALTPGALQPIPAAELPRPGDIAQGFAGLSRRGH